MRAGALLITSVLAVATLGGCALLTPKRIETPEAAIQIAKKSCITTPQDSDLIWGADYWLGMWHIQAVTPTDPKNVVYAAVVWRNG